MAPARPRHAGQFGVEIDENRVGEMAGAVGFPAGRPAWERAGAVLTGDAGPWERLKLRTLNGVHSAIAYLGALAGRETIAEAMFAIVLADALLEKLGGDSLDEMRPRFAALRKADLRNLPMDDHPWRLHSPADPG